MHQAYKILKYIIENNPWYALPWRVSKAIFYQMNKRIRKKAMLHPLFNGKKIWLFPKNPVCSSFVYTAYPDKIEIDWLRKLATDETIFLDIGANIGAYSILLSDKVKDMYAFEAHPQTAQLCKMNYSLNGISEHNVIVAAVSSDCEKQYFTNLSEGSPMNALAKEGRHSIEVPGMTLDAFAVQKAFSLTQPFIIKMDVEGFEDQVLLGAQNFLKNYAVKAIVFEIFSSKKEEIKQFLQELGFVLIQTSEHNMLAIREEHAV